MITRRVTDFSYFFHAIVKNATNPRNVLCQKSSNSVLGYPRNFNFLFFSQNLFTMEVGTMFFILFVKKCMSSFGVIPQGTVVFIFLSTPTYVFSFIGVNCHVFTKGCVTFEPLATQMTKFRYFFQQICYYDFIPDIKICELYFSVKVLIAHKL